MTFDHHTIIDAGHGYRAVIVGDIARMQQFRHWLWQDCGVILHRTAWKAWLAERLGNGEQSPDNVVPFPLAA